MMGIEDDLSDKVLELTYWQAAIAFGYKAVRTALNESPWRERFPNIVTGASSSDIPTMRANNDTILPGVLIYEIAGRNDVRYDYFANEDETRLYSAERRDPPHTPIEGWHEILPQEALLKYGAYAIFYSVDNLYGMRGQRNPVLEP